MKKIAFLALGLIVVAGIVSAETRITFGGGYSQNSLKIDDDTFGSLQTTTKAPAIAIDAMTMIGTSNIAVFGGFQAAFPSKTEWKAGLETNEDTPSSTNYNASAGVGYEFLSATKFPVLLGLGLSFNNTTQKFDFAKITSSSIGLVGTLQGNYFFTDHFGATLGLDYAYYMIPLSYDMESGGSTTSYKDEFSYTTNLNIRAGLSYRF